MSAFSREHLAMFSKSAFFGRTKNTTLGHRRAFTFVELIAVVSVIGALSVIGFAYASGYKEQSYNAKRFADIDVLQNAADTYFVKHGDYPEPKANSVYYDQDGNYVHSESGATYYGVSSWVSPDLFGVDILRDVPKDPSTNTYYAYGKKRADGSKKWAYDFATVDRRDDRHFAYVRGNYVGDVFSSLVREFNTANYIVDGGTRLPYNPYEQKLTGLITSSKGTFEVTRNGVPIGAFTGELTQSDTITVSTGSLIVIHLSDGSEIKLGSPTKVSVLELSELQYKDNSLFSQVRVKLLDGEMWIKAPRLMNEAEMASELEISTNNNLAAVRGTIVGVQTSSSDSSTGTITLAAGEVKLFRIEGEREVAVNVEGTPNKTLVATGGVIKQATGSLAGTLQSANLTVNNTEVTSAIKAELGRWDTGIIAGKKPNVVGINKSASILSVKLAVGPEDTGLFVCSGEQCGKNAATSSDFPAALNEDSIQTRIFQYTASTKDFPIRFCAPRSNYPLEPDTNACGDETIIDLSSVGDMSATLKTSEDCDPKDQFGPLGCLGSDTIAYAPYDLVGDLNMYYKGSSFAANGRLDMLPVKTNGWKSNEIDDAMKKALADVGIFYANSTFPYSSGITAYNTPVVYRKNFEKDSLLSNIYPPGNLTFSPSTGAGKIAYGEDNGVVIGTLSSSYTPGYLAYNLSPLGLSESFSIEIGVRGSALNKSNTVTHFLASSWPVIAWDNGSSNFRLFIKNNGTLKICNTSLSCSDIWHDEIKDLDDDTFYTIQYKRQSPSMGMLSIISPSGQSLTTKKITSNAPFINTTEGSSIKDLFIGSSSNTSEYQWNDTISFVKIY